MTTEQINRVVFFDRFGFALSQVPLSDDVQIGPFEVPHLVERVEIRTAKGWAIEFHHPMLPVNLLAGETVSIDGLIRAMPPKLMAYL